MGRKYEYWGMFEHPPDDFRLNSNDVVVYIENFKVVRFHLYRIEPPIDYEENAMSNILLWEQICKIPNTHKIPNTVLSFKDHTEPIFQIIRFFEIPEHDRIEIAGVYRESVLNKLETATKEIGESIKNLRDKKVNIPIIFELERKLEFYESKFDYFKRRRKSKYFFFKDIIRPLIDFLEKNSLQQNEIIIAIDKLFRIFNFDGYNNYYYENSQDFEETTPIDAYNYIKKIVY